MKIASADQGIAVLEYDWENSVGYWICTTSHAIRRALSNRLAQERMTLRQWEVLACLSQRQNSSQAEIAECLGIEPHTLTGIISRMERDGWVKRVASSTDRRRYFILPTERGHEVWTRAVEWCREVRSQALTGFSADEARLMKEFCERIRANLDDDTCAPCPKPQAEQSVAPDLELVDSVN
jgi:MarR family transcriptional regulator for hemolysin